jgi:hypothetical protein
VSQNPNLTVEESSRRNINAGNEIPQFYMADVWVEVPIDPKNLHAGSKWECQRKEKCKILIPGDREERDDLVIPGYQDKRWPEAYARFKAGEAAQQTGTPLSQCPFLGAALRDTLNREGIYTIEQFLSVSHTNLQRIHGAIMVRPRIEEWWAVHKDSQRAAEVTAELAAERAKREALEAKLEAFMARFGEPEPVGVEHLEAGTESGEVAAEEVTAVAKPRGRRKAQ